MIRCRILIVAFSSLFLLAACGGSSEPSQELIDRAVQATIEAMPTPAPQTVEVTVPEATPKPEEAPATPETTTETTDNNTADNANDSGCPATSERQFDLITMTDVDTNHPDNQHADLNLALRGAEPVDVALDVVELGGVDPDAPQLAGLFADGRRPAFTSAAQVYDWDWACGDHGCSSGLVSDYEASLLGLATNPGEELRPPSRNGKIVAGGYIAAVLYAEPTRITLAYAQGGTVANGYAIHLENICVDTNLLAAYQSANANGRGELPGLKNGEVLGTAPSNEIKVAVRNKGTFLDPRSRGDWWKNQ